MPRRTNEFQSLIAVVQSHLDEGAVVEESALLEDMLTGTKREVDICVRGCIARQPVIISLECRDRGRTADVSWVEEMQSKHSRLATNQLVLVSHKGFTTEAIRVANKYNIRRVDWVDVASSSSQRLFPDLDSLWGKTWTLSIEKVSITVAGSDSLPVETVRASPDTAIYLQNGSYICSALEMANALLRLENIQAKLGSDALPEHKFAQIGWNRLTHESMRMCLQKLEPLMFRPIQDFRVTAKCAVEVGKFPLRHGKYDAVRVAWGTAPMTGQDMLLVATEDSGGAKISLRSTQSPKNPKP